MNCSWLVHINFPVPALRTIPSEQDAWPADLIRCWDIFAARFLREFLSELATPASKLRIPVTFALSGKTLEFLVTRHPSIANQLSTLLQLPSINWLAGLFHYSAFEIMDSIRLTASLGQTGRITKSLVSKPAVGFALPLLSTACSIVRTRGHGCCIVEKNKIFGDQQYKVGDRVLFEEAAKSMRDLHIGLAASDFPCQYAKDEIESRTGKSVISAIDVWDLMTFKPDRLLEAYVQSQPYCVELMAHMKSTGYGSDVPSCPRGPLGSDRLIDAILGMVADVARNPDAFQPSELHYMMTNFHSIWHLELDLGSSLHRVSQDFFESPFALFTGMIAGIKP